MTDREFIYTMLFVGADAKIKRTGELIRCKDCKHMHEDGVESYCDDSGRYIDGTGFCKWAERKEE